MSLINKISEEIALRIEGESLSRKKAQENIEKKRANELKQQEFDKMLDKVLPADKIIRLKNENDEVQYFQMMILSLMKDWDFGMKIRNV